MANPLKGEVAFKIDGDAYVLKYDVNRLCELEGIFPGQHAADIIAKAREGSVTALRGCMWAGLREQDVSLIEAGEIVQKLSPIAAGQKIMEAVALAFPKPQEEGEGDEDPQKGAAKAA